ncbi:hypothetical protein NECAME_11266, partial [Necator americanus]
MMKSPRHDFMLQARFEQPPETLWEERVRSTVMTGLAVRDNQSSVVQVFARKDHRRWRYRTDVYVDGERIFFDMPWKKIQTFSGVTIRSPPRNMNQSELEIMFASGAGLRIEESRGLLNVVVALPHTFNESNWRSWEETKSEPFFWETTTQTPIFSRFDKCSTYYRTVGLLGTYNGDPYDDLTTPDCMEIRTNYPQSEPDARNIYYEFGRLDRNLHIPSLFQPEYKPIYDPLSFADDRYIPLFDPWHHSDYSSWSGLIFSREEVKVLCQGVPACEYDFMSSGRREDALDTLEYERKFELKKQKGEIR